MIVILLALILLALLFPGFLRMIFQLLALLIFGVIVLALHH